MATLQNIRNRGSLLIAIVIGIALGAFILGDMLNSGSSLMKPQQLEIAEIDGEAIQYPDFQKKVDELSEIYKMNTQQNQIDENTWIQIREQVWQSYLQENILGKAATELGLSVTAEELFDLVQGRNPHPTIQQLFRNPQTGEVDKSAIIQFLKSIDTNATPQQKTFWLYIEDQIKTDKLRTKYNNLVSKGLYTTSNEAKTSLEQKNKTVNFQFIALNYASIADSTVKVSESELKEYYNKHKDEYKQEKTRKIEYITFEVLPSSSDFAATQKWINDSKEEFASVTDNEQYINVNSDVRFDPTFYKKEEVAPTLAAWVATAQPNEFYGPYFENNEYKLSKIDQFKMMPDSVQASHILINPQTKGGVERARSMADSLKNLIEKGASFSELAMKYSEDPGSASKGGDLGWFKRRQMVPEFEEASFNGEVNKLYIVGTQFGFHIIKPTKRGKETNCVRIATLVRKVEPSTETYQKIYSETSKFASENQEKEDFNKAIVEQKLDKRIATMKEADRDVAGLESSRQLVRSAFQASKGDILVNPEGSTIFEFGNKFVIALLTDATEEGISSFAEAKLRVELAVKKEKKAALLSEKIKSAASGQNDLSIIASKLSTDVREANGVNFSTFSVPVMGFEPAVVGTVCSLSEGKLTSPIEGNNGVYLAKITSVVNNSGSDVKSEQKSLAQNTSARASTQAFESLKKLADVVDKRAKFY